MATTDIATMCGNLTLADVDDEEVSVQLPIASVNLENEEEVFYVVGRLVTNKPVRLPFFHDTMADVWSPVMGVNVKELSPRRYLFRFYLERDIDRVIAEGPYSYDQCLLILRRVPAGQDPELVPLMHAEFWVQIHALSGGFQSEAIVRAIGSFMGTFIRADERNFDGAMRSFFCVRVAIDVAKPLKKQMKLKMDNGGWAIIDFKYERIQRSASYVESLVTRNEVESVRCGFVGSPEKVATDGLRVPEVVVSDPKQRRTEGVGVVGMDCEASGSKNLPEAGLAAQSRQGL
ncbi:PREDICTED: uncharacterized protein LOC109167357 [Ipomoea nil]|uniref:uncharacterized protein LOC109167357 n=1 Tax=Ipomoea nil TaxID=35883 RepID=UPI000900B0A0|nr:PREDICTED: uncharacterized protein LOC109167357 [Ipomoea nil]